MKKYIISIGLGALAVTSAYAQSEARPEPAEKPVARPALYAKAVNFASTTGQPVRAVAATMIAAQALPFIPTTGDAATDKAIKALHEEMESKIKVIRDEYQAKIKSAIGDKKILNRDARASTTLLRQEIRQDVRQEVKEWRDDKRDARSSSTMASSSERRPMMRAGERPAGAVRGAETSAEGEAKPGVFGFFSKMFAR